MLKPLQVIFKDELFENHSSDKYSWLNIQDAQVIMLKDWMLKETKVSHQVLYLSLKHLLKILPLKKQVIYDIQYLHRMLRTEKIMEKPLKRFSATIAKCFGDSFQDIFQIEKSWTVEDFVDLIKTEIDFFRAYGEILDRSTKWKWDRPIDWWCWIAEVYEVGEDKWRNQKLYNKQCDIQQVGDVSSISSKGAAHSNTKI